MFASSLGSTALYGGLAVASGFSSHQTSQNRWISTAPKSTHKHHKKSNFERALGAVGTLFGYRLRGMPVVRREYPNLQALAHSGDKGKYGSGTYGDEYSHFLLSIDSSKNKDFWNAHSRDKEWCKKAYSQQVSYSSGSFGADAVFKYCSVSGAYPADREDWGPGPSPVIPSDSFMWAV